MPAFTSAGLRLYGASTTPGTTTPCRVAAHSFGQIFILPLPKAISEGSLAAMVPIFGAAERERIMKKVIGKFISPVASRSATPVQRVCV